MKTSKNITSSWRCARLNLLASTLFIIVSLSINAEEMSGSFSLDFAIEQAQKNDPWLAENRHEQAALESRSIAAGTLPDPRVSLGLVNIGADNLDFNQEDMTQLKAEISQMFPRGDSLQLQTRKLQLLSQQNPHLRDDRKRQVAVTVATIWLDVFKAKESIRLIDNDRSLFEQLVEISEASYSTAYGGTQQQDVIRAQLELTRLDDRLTQLKQQQEVSQKRLGQWVSGQFMEHYSNFGDTSITYSHFSDIDSQSLPQRELISPELMEFEDAKLAEILTGYLVKHPAVSALESRIEASNTDVELTRQKYKAQWGINAGYGYRGNNDSGTNRADLFSLGVSFDLPIFTENRQDKQVAAAVSEAESIKTQKWMLLRKMIAEFEAAKVQLQRLNQRHQLYQHQLLPQIHEQAEAALTAYTNDEGDFSEVVRARIDVLDAEIDKLDIDVERQKIISQLNYFLVGSDTPDNTAAQVDEQS
jgi:outer membrane protein TolC